MQNYKTIRLIQGINRNINPFLVEEGQLYDSQNVGSGKVGAVCKAGRYAQKYTQISSSKDVLAIGTMTRGGSSAGSYNRYVVVDQTIYMEKDDDSGWETQTGAGAGLTTGKVGQFFSMPERDALFYVNGTDATRCKIGSSWSTATNVTDAPKASYGIVNDTYAFLGRCTVGTTSYPARIYYSSSAIGGELTWDTTNDYHILPEPINGFARSGSDIFAVTLNYIYKVDAYGVQKVANVGASSQAGITSGEGWIYVASVNGVFATRGADPTLISEPIQDFIENASSYDIAFSKGHLYCHLGDITIDDVTYDNVVMDYNTKTNTWQRNSYGTNVKVLQEVINDSGGSEVWIGNDDGEVFLLGSGTTQDTADYASFVETQPWYFADGALGTALSLDVWGKSLTDMTVLYKSDAEPNYKVAGVLDRDSSSIQFKCRGTYLQLKFAEAGSLRDWEIYRYRIGYDAITEGYRRDEQLY